MNQRTGFGRTALVTGASAGIGAALARVFARNGFDLVLTARRADRLSGLQSDLQRVHGITARVIVADLAQPGAPAEIVAEATAHAPIDVLVNNAGYGLPGLYADTAWEAQRDFLQVMVTAPCELVHRLLPAMQARRYGRILNIASVAGLVPGGMSHTLYGASKAHMIRFSEALYAETQGTGVHVTALCPGFTVSEFHDVNHTRAQMSRLPKFLWLSAEDVAEAGYAAVMRGSPLSIPGFAYKVITAAAHLLPRRALIELSLQAGRFRRKTADLL
jgi:short-subunit dehydrogenase